MLTRNSFVPLWIVAFLLFSACSTPVRTDVPVTHVPTTDYVESVGRVLSSTPTTVFPQKIHASQDAIWYWFEECGCVVKFDPESGKEVASIQINEGTSGPYGNPKDMAIDGNVIWVIDAGNSAVVQIDPNINQIVERIPLAVTNAAGKTEQIQPFGLALDGTTLWVSDFDKNYVLRVDTVSKEVVALIGDIQKPEGIAINSDGVWVVEHRSGNIVRIDPATNTVTATILIPTPEQATPNGRCGMCIDYVVAMEDAVWVPLNLGNGVARIDPETNQVSAVIPLDFSPRMLAVTEGVVWAAGGLASPKCMQAAGGIARIDSEANTIIGTISLPCAASVGLFKGDIWVGSGFPGDSMITQVKPE